MVKYYDSISPTLEEWAMKQQVFFTASAPLTGKHINVSPKGLPSASLRILGPNLCAYIDATGSGIETISHIHENGRVTIMFCSFGPAPQIMRLFCTGMVVEWCDRGFNGWLKRMGEKKVIGARAIIVLDVWKVQTSCGFAVPYLAVRPDPMDTSKQEPYLEDRRTLGHWGEKRVAAGEMDEYRAKTNAHSLDGLPGLRRARKDAGETLWYGDMKERIKPRNRYTQMALVGILSALLTLVSMFMLGLMRPDLSWNF